MRILTALKTLHVFLSSFLGILPEAIPRKNNSKKMYKIIFCSRIHTHGVSECEDKKIKHVLLEVVLSSLISFLVEFEIIFQSDRQAAVSSVDGSRKKEKKIRN